MLGHPAEELVGRAVELAEVDAALAALEEGAFAALAVVGEPGIGKTSVLAALASRADARGHLVLSGAASELERDLPFWVFADALDDYVQVEPARLDAAQLFLSQKTVETHVRHLFQKLGVSSRVEVARAVERADRLG